MYYEVSFVTMFDPIRHEPVFSSKLFRNRELAFKFMVEKINRAPCMFVYNKTNYNLFCKKESD